MTSPFERAAHELADRRRNGRRGPRLPADARPADIAAGLRLQHRVTELLGDVIAGWKCALPTAKRTIVAPLFAPLVRRASPCAVAERDGRTLIEPEIAFVLAQDLPGGRAHTEADVRAAIGAAHCVLELMGNRYDDPGAVPFPEMLADYANNHGLYVGPQVRDALARPLERIPLAIRARGAVLMTRDGAHPDGHPLRPLVWLANYLPTQGTALRAGDIVTTGSYAGALEVPLDVPLDIEFGDLGTISVELAARP